MSTCAYCHKPIAGVYITALDQPWHTDCFRCAGCGRVIGEGSFIPAKGKPYHPACYNQLFGLRCAAGGELIGQKRYFEKDGKTYCEEHYWQRFGKLCAIGGETLKGEYLINSWGETYCHAHAKDLSECFSCGRPICQRLTGGGLRYQDSRTLCNRCRVTAVDDDGRGQAILMQVRKTMATWGLDAGRVETPLHLVDQNELKRRSNRAHSQKPAGMACHQTTTQNGQVIERRVEAILILHGLPEEHFAAVAAHELCHTYLFINGFPELEPFVEEGLCELTQYLWLRQQHTHEAEHRIAGMEANDDPIYGNGYRAARRGYERMGLPALLDFVRRQGRLPA